MKKFQLTTLLLALTVTSCVSLEELAPPVDETFLLQSGASINEVPELKQGRNLYTARCGSCHSLDKVNAYSYPEWQRIMDVEEMAAKSKFSTSETNAVLSYLKKAILVADKRSEAL